MREGCTYLLKKHKQKKFKTVDEDSFYVDLFYGSCHKICRVNVVTKCIVFGICYCFLTHVNTNCPSNKRGCKD